MTSLIIIVSLLVFGLGAAAVVRKMRASSALPARSRASDPFIIKPYLQLGDNPKRLPLETLELRWVTADEGNLWAVEMRAPGSDRWIGADLPEEKRIALPGTSVKRRYTTRLSRLAPGQEFEYRVLRGGEQVFLARGRAPKGADKPIRFVAVGDLCNGNLGSRKIAHQISLKKPDLLVLAGDVAYKRGRVSEYRDLFFPAYNADAAYPGDGGPVLRSTVAAAVFGNHDAGTPELWDVRDFDAHPDLLAYFLFWSQPLNGPLPTPGSANTPDLKGHPARQTAFLAAAGNAYPRGANYSLDYGDTHWLMLDANVYMDWTNAELRAWVENDLRSSTATWKFVVLHQGPFSSDVKHRDEQRMRLLTDIFQAHGVDVVFSGHNHAYERSHPLSFRVKPQPDGKLMSPEGRVDGDISLDTSYDGKDNTRPNGILYIVTGGGGGKLYLEMDRRADRSKLPSWTRVIVDEMHSFTLCEVVGKTLTFKQIAEDGSLVDTFVITK